ncbi:MAG TPA: glycosyltransferase family 4 protein [Ornithinibacter sp.]|nr:glycosyltransferase family 4 protein [Ornithinibacter sp.]
MPPTTYGGTEGFLDTLARGLLADGHEIRLFTIGDSTCPVPRCWVFGSAPEPMGLALHEAVQVRAAYDDLVDCEVIHDNTTIGPMWATATDHPCPVVVTCHGALNAVNTPLYADLARWASFVAISRHQRASAPSVPFATVIHHGLDPDRFPVGDGSGGYAMFLGRLAPEKGAVAALEIARRSGMPLRLAAKMREPAEREYFERFVRPRLGRDVEFLGEITPDERNRQLGGAVALLNPITWAEPFGLVMVEAMVCGTPVISYPNGAAPEIVEDGTTGFLCDGVDEAVAALGKVGGLDRTACRAHVEAEFSASLMVSRYERLYRKVIAARSARGRPPAAGSPLRGPRRRPVRRTGAP